MLATEVFKVFYLNLIKQLPMSDSSFTAALCSQNLLPEYLNEQVKSLPHIGKAENFLDNVIKPAIALGDISSFMKLLELLEKSHDQYIAPKKLANQIRLSIQECASATIHVVNHLACADKSVDGVNGK